MKHTPGPWEILKQNHNLYIGHKEPDQWTTSGFRWEFVGRPVPEQKSGAKRGTSPNWLGWSERIEANAKLIAAAPELLEACNALVAAWNDAPMELGRRDDRWQAMNAALAAIAKAEGKE